MSYFAATITMKSEPLTLPTIHYNSTVILTIFAIVFGIICLGIAWVAIDDWLINRKFTKAETERHIRMHNDYLRKLNRKHSNQ